MNSSDWMDTIDGSTLKERNDDTITNCLSTTVERCEDISKDVNQNLEKQKTIEGNAYFHRLGWRRLTIVLIVNAVALGSLGIPSAFATLGMVCGAILCVGIGLVAMYASYIVGQVKIKFPHVAHYVDIGHLMLGRLGFYIFTAVFTLQLVLLIGSHCLTGRIAFATITNSHICSIVFSVVSAIVLFLLAIPPSFTEVAILGYIDFASIVLAIGFTIVVTGIQQVHPSGEAVTTWSAWPKEDIRLSEAFIAVNNIVFAYSFAAAQPSFMEEMHTPTDYVKSIMVLGIVQIIIYTLTGAMIYAFVGRSVQSPALSSAGTLWSRVVFGIALPVIFISGSINTTVVCRFIHGQMYRNSIVRYVNTRLGWATWIALVAVTTLIAWIIAEVIPFFSELLSISSSLFVSGLSFYLPPLMWFMLLKEGKWYSRHNIIKAICNGIVLLIGLTILGCGTYASVVELIKKFNSGSVTRPFSCQLAVQASQ